MRKFKDRINPGKIKIVFRAASIIFSGILFAGCIHLDDAELNSAHDRILIEKAINNSIGWAGNKDLGVLYNVIADDSSFLEVHPGNKIVKGISEFKKAENFWMHPDFKAIRYEIRDLNITISQSGTVAWWFCMLDDINEWKGQPANWEDTRWTGVLEKRDGKWVIVQQHFSFASE